MLTVGPTVNRRLTEALRAYGPTGLWPYGPMALRAYGPGRAIIGPLRGNL